MWLPTPFYERAPHYWLLIGLLLIVVGMYLGFEIHRVYMFVGLGFGVASCLWSARVFARRKPRQQESRMDDYLDQTCELNYRPEDS